jgi:phosphatidyl-myo-inositol alpha-mannosyltransferase
VKIALLWPDTWPYIRRGTERMVNDIARFLISQGHEVHVIASKPGGPQVRREGNLTVHLLRQVSHPVLMSKRWVPRFDTHGLLVLPVLLRERFDLIHAFFYSYAPSLRFVQATQGTPYVYHVVSIPPVWNRPFDDRLFDLALGGASAVRVFSKFCADYVAKHHGAESYVVPPTVDLEWFRPVVNRKVCRSEVLFTGDLADERKGADVMVEAFNRLHRRQPETVLVLAGPTGLGVAERVLGHVDPELMSSVEIPGPGTLGSLPARYASASVTVLPSRGEPFGMVYTESMACGTPAVGAREGAVPEIISDPGVGATFDFAPERTTTLDNLVDAMEYSLNLAADPETIVRCRQHAQQWTWDAVGPKFVEMQEAAISGKTRAGEMRSQ